MAGSPLQLGKLPPEWTWSLEVNKNRKHSASSKDRDFQDSYFFTPLITDGWTTYCGFEDEISPRWSYDEIIECVQKNSDELYHRFVTRNDVPKTSADAFAHIKEVFAEYTDVTKTLHLLCRDFE